MQDIKFIYWFAYYNEDSPSVRYRAKYPLEYFKQKFNVDSALIIPGYNSSRVFIFIKSYLSALFFRKKNSIIVIQRVHSNFIYSNLLKLLVILRNNYTIYDLDDADYIYMPSKNIYWFARKCHFIAAGSRKIKEHLLPFNDKIIITTSPTPDLGLYKKEKNNVFNIGWIGGFSGDHKKSLVSYVFPAIKSLNIRCKFTLIGITKIDDLKFVQDYFSDNELVEISIPMNVDWKNELEIQERILEFDIGIATLLDNEIQLSKSGIKAKQYLNNGVPVLGTKLPENDWVIKDSINGYYCNSEIDFKERIMEFYEMEDHLYSRFLEKARESISEFDHIKYFSDLKKINML